MASERLNVVVYLTVMVIAAAVQMQSTDAQKKTHTLDWIIPTNPNTFSTWAASQKFTVGDTLVFNFTTGQHTAAQVKKASYDACTTTKPISLWTTGPSSVTLNSSGAHYYLCTISGHCNGGQKVAITVAAAATPPASAPSPKKSSPSPTPTPTPTEASAPGSTTTPSAPGSTTTPSGSASPSSASFVATALPFTFLSAAIMALFY